LGKDPLSTKQLSCGMSFPYLFKKLLHYQFLNVLLKIGYCHVLFDPITIGEFIKMS